MRAGESKRFWTDRGTEFYNKVFATWIKSKNITLYSTYGDSKSVVAERFIRTIRTNIEREFTESKSKNWVAKLPTLVKTYNNTKHSTIKMKPIDASKPENETIVFNRLTKKPHIKLASKVAKFKVGDKVKISKIKQTFDKGYAANWSFEAFSISEVIDTYLLHINLLIMIMTQ